jgi:hypothetical protein
MSTDQITIDRELLEVCLLYVARAADPERLERENMFAVTTVMANASHAGGMEQMDAWLQDKANGVTNRITKVLQEKGAN